MLMMRTLTALILATLALSASTQAQTNSPSKACGFFSPNPDDTSGPPVVFYADLSADEESAVTESPGSGRVDFQLDRASLKLSWTLTFKNLTSPPTGVHIHGPQTPGGEAGILIDLAPGGVKSGAVGSSVLNDGLLAYLVQDRMYVNLHTTKYPMGELRSPIKKARPKC
jgi:hypothetical protein